MDKEIFGYIALILALAAYCPYIWSTFRGKTRPHIFTWIIWGLVMTIAASAQYAGAAGPGSWAPQLGGILSFVIVVLAYKQGEKNITLYDVLIFIAALSAIPLWQFTHNPLTAIIIVTMIDLLGYLPTFRKAYTKPYEEMCLIYIISNLMHGMSIVAMNTYSITTILYPIALFIGNSALVGMIYWRRSVLR